MYYHMKNGDIKLDQELFDHAVESTLYLMQWGYRVSYDASQEKFFVYDDRNQKQMGIYMNFAQLQEFMKKFEAAEIEAKMNAL